MAQQVFNTTLIARLRSIRKDCLKAAFLPKFGYHPDLDKFDDGCIGKDFLDLVESIDKILKRF